MTISTVPGLLEAVVARLHSDVDAVRLVNNLAANSGVSAALFVKTPGAVEALKVAACKFQLHAFGVINHLSRSPESAVGPRAPPPAQQQRPPCAQARDE